MINLPTALPTDTPESIYAQMKLYRWLEYVVNWHGHLSVADVADAKKVLAEFVHLKAKP